METNKSKQVVEYNVTDAAISDMKTRYMALTVKGLDDREGLEEVHEARMVVKGKRIEVEKKRKELKADALAWGQKVDSEARRIFKLLEPIETHLTNEEEKITKEKERIRAEKERKLNDMAQARVDACAKVGFSLPFDKALTMPQVDYDSLIKDMTDLYEAEQKKIAEEKRAREEEASRLAKERAELEALKAEEAKRQAEAQRKLDEERKKIEAERLAVENAKREQEHREAIERAKKEAAEMAERNAKERMEREAREKAEADARAKAESERQERIKPEKIKLTQYAARLMEVAPPDVTTEPAISIVSEVERRIAAINKYIIKASQEL